MDPAAANSAEPAARPSLSEGEALSLLLAAYGLTAVGRLEPLPSYDDQNFLVRCATGEAFVLKIHNAAEDDAIIDMQNALLCHLDARGILVPAVVSSLSGQWTVPHDVRGCVHAVRLLRYVPGTVLRDARHTVSLLRDLGGFLARMDDALCDFSHPAADTRQLRWDVARVLESRDRLCAVASEERRRVLEAILDELEVRVLPRLSGLRHAVVHNDAHELNVLVDGASGRVAAVIDFGDAVRTAVACNLAIAQAYAMMLANGSNCDEDIAGRPGAAFAAVRDGYEAVHPLQAEERALLPWLVLARLCISVLSSAHKQQLFPDDPYVRISEAPAWKLIGQLWPALAEGSFPA